MKVSRVGKAGWLLPFLAVSALLVAAQTGKVEIIGGLTDSSVSDAVRKAMEPRGYRLILDDGSAAGQIWLRRGMASGEQKEVSGVLYPQLAESTLVGVISFSSGTTDYRGEAIQPGTYTLRYALLPNDGNHLGVAPNRDFLLLIPAASDPDPNAIYKFQELVRLSSQATGTAHPAPISMVQPHDGAEASIMKDEDGHWVFSAKLAVGSGEIPFSFVIKGTAPQ